MYDLFLFITDYNIPNFVDDTALYVCDRKMKKTKKLATESIAILERFQNNYLKANSRTS